MGDYRELSDTLDYIDSLADSIAYEDSLMTEEDLNKVSLVKTIYSKIPNTILENDIDVKCKLHEPFMSSGAICISGKHITICNPQQFVNLAIHCDNLNIWSNNGEIKIDLAFDGLMRGE